MRGFISAAALALYGLGSAQNPVLLEDLRYAATDKTAWKIGPPKALAMEARQGFVSPDGKWVIAALGPPMMDGRMLGSRLVLINATTGAQTALGQIRPDEVLADVTFSADSSLVSLMVLSELLMEEGHGRAVVYSTALGSFSQAVYLPLGATLHAFGSGSLAAYHASQDGGEASVQVFSPEAQAWQINDLLTGFVRQGWRFIWQESSLGRPLLIRGSEIKWLDPAAGRLTDWQEPAEEEGLDLLFSASEKPGQAALWPRASDKVRAVAVLSQDASWAQLSSGGGAAIYISDAVLFLRRVEPLDYLLYRSVQKEEVKKQAMSTAKQAGLAVMMYSTDYDDVLPGKRATDALMPYVKNKAILDAVSWTNLGGQSFSSITNPSQTELGYVQTEFGTAVIMADGSVQWRDKPGG
jgi:hypothetical protein